LVLFTAVYAATPSTKITYSDPLKTIVVKKSSPEFSILLQSNATTGFSWTLKSYDSNIISPILRKYYPPVAKKLLGAGGYEKWTFRVRGEGFVVPQTTNISLIYARSWDQQGAQISTFKVVTYDDQATN
jgi:inhibitor of cysteine peptidase